MGKLWRSLRQYATKPTVLSRSFDAARTSKPNFSGILQLSKQEPNDFSPLHTSYGWVVIPKKFYTKANVSSISKHLDGLNLSSPSPLELQYLADAWLGSNDHSKNIEHVIKKVKPVVETTEFDVAGVKKIINKQYRELQLLTTSGDYQSVPLVHPDCDFDNFAALYSSKLRRLNVVTDYEYYPSAHPQLQFIENSTPKAIGGTINGRMYYHLFFKTKLANWTKALFEDFMRQEWLFLSTADQAKFSHRYKELLNTGYNIKSHLVLKIGLRAPRYA